MTSKIRRLILILAASSGLIATSTLPAYAGLNLLAGNNHCEPTLQP